MASDLVFLDSAAAARIQHIEGFDSEITFIDGSGDTTIQWQQSSHDEMLKVIDNLMKSGHVFCVAEYDDAGARTGQRQIGGIEELSSRSAIVRDETLRTLYDNNSLRVVHSFKSIGASLLRTIAPILSAEAVVTMAAAPPRENRRVVCLPQYRGG